MIANSAMDKLLDALHTRAKAGKPVNFWLRDDDAIEPCESLDRLLILCEEFSVPLTLAVIPAHTDDALAHRLSLARDVSVAVHGWSHTNYAGTDEKKQELGNHRPQDDVLAELRRGFTRLRELHRPRFVPLLVPPWNRISPDIVKRLHELGFVGLSTYGDEKPTSVLSINTQVDIIDWKGTRGGYAVDYLATQMTIQLHEGRSSIGILSHQLVHDEAAWLFLEQLFDATAGHPGVRWLPVSEWLSA